METIFSHCFHTVLSIVLAQHDNRKLIGWKLGLFSGHILEPFMPLCHVLHLGLRCIAERRSAFEWQAAQQGLEGCVDEKRKARMKSVEGNSSHLAEWKENGACKNRTVFLWWQRYVKAAKFGSPHLFEAWLMFATQLCCQPRQTQSQRLWEF